MKQHRIEGFQARLLVLGAAVAVAALVGACSEPESGPTSTATPNGTSAAATATGTAAATGSAPATPTGQATIPAGTPKPGQAGRVAKAGDTVSVNYTGTLDDGKEFDSSKGREPLKFTIGAGDVIVGFDRAVTGLEVGKSAKVRMEAKEAYGERRDDLIVKVPIADAPPGLQVGQRVSIGQRPAVVTAINSTEVTVDANHELAGKALTFEVMLVSFEN